MKKILRLFLAVFIIFVFSLKDSNAAEYVLFEFISVSDQNREEYLSAQPFWSQVYEQMKEDKAIWAWQLFSLSPSGIGQGEQYLMVTVLGDLGRAISLMDPPDFMDYAIKAFPDKSTKELKAMIESTSHSREIVDQYLFEQIDRGQKVNFQMKVGFVAALELTKQLYDNYEQVASNVFKPFYQSLVNDGMVGHWGLLRAILPYGSDAYATHISFLFFNDMDQLSDFMTESNYPVDLKSTPEFQNALKTRDLKKLVIAKLLMMV